MTNISEKNTGSCKDREYIVTRSARIAKQRLRCDGMWPQTATRRSALIAAIG